MDVTSHHIFRDQPRFGGDSRQSSKSLPANAKLVMSLSPLNCPRHFRSILRVETDAGQGMFLTLGKAREPLDPQDLLNTCQKISHG